MYTARSSLVTAGYSPGVPAQVLLGPAKLLLCPAEGWWDQGTMGVYWRVQRGYHGVQSSFCHIPSKNTAGSRLSTVSLSPGRLETPRYYSVQVRF
jgi:hypothetical protein